MNFPELFYYWTPKPLHYYIITRNKRLIRLFMTEFCFGACILRRDFQLISVLLLHFDVDIIMKYYATELYWLATRYKQPWNFKYQMKILKYLFDYSCKYNPANVLRYMVEGGRLDIIEFLVKNYPYILQSKPGIVNSAILFGKDEIVKYLIENGALFDERVMDVICFFNQKNAIEYVMKNIDRSLIDYELFLKVANKQGKPELYEYISQNL